MKLLISKFGNLRNVVRNSTIVDRLASFNARLKGGRIEQIGLYWKGIFFDYKEVILDVVKDGRTNPKKAIVIGTGLCLAVFAAKTVPDERTFYNQLLANANRLSLVNEPLRKPEADRHVRLLTSSYNGGRIRYLNLGLFSLIWLDDSDQRNALYSAQCSYLRPKYADFHQRIIDIGAYGRWHLIERKFIDYDVNPEESS